MKHISNPLSKHDTCFMICYLIICIVCVYNSAIIVLDQGSSNKSMDL